MTKEQAIERVEDDIRILEKAIRRELAAGKDAHQSTLVEYARSRDALQMLVDLVKNPPIPMRDWGSNYP